MITLEFGPLYAKASTGKIKTWKATIVDDGEKVHLNTLHGYVGGKQASNSKEIKGKNIGRANETTPWIQAEMDVQSKMNKKKDEGYVENQEELEDQTLLLPMLAHPYTKRKHNIDWPAYVQPKLNGVRCLARMTENDPEYISRKGKKWNTLDHLNKAVEKLTCELGVPIDGEIFNPKWTFQEITRAVKKDRGEVTDELEYWVYDIVDVNSTFEKRIENLRNVYVEKLSPHTFLKLDHKEFPRIGKVVLVPTFEVNNEADMMAAHDQFTKAGYEGTIIRNKKGKYELKNRSKDLQKYKTMLDEEYVVTGAHEGTGNDIGTVVFECITETGQPFSARPKGSREIRRQYLEDIENIKGKKVTVQYQEKSELGVPIFPVILAIRDYE